MLVKGQVLGESTATFVKTKLPGAWVLSKVNNHNLTFYVLSRKSTKLLSNLDIIPLGCCLIHEKEDTISSKADEIFLGLDARSYSSVTQEDVKYFIKNSLKFIDKYFKILGVLEQPEAEKLLLDYSNIVPIGFS